jgi:cob(I)alamin adenosyltransferase
MPRSANTSTQKSKLYTRSGDTGTTMLFGGGRMPKDHPRVEAYGTVDELNSTLGVALSFMPARGAIPKALGNVQNELFNIGSELASGTTGKAAEKARLFIDADAKIASLERLIDEYDAKVPPLRTFILPSGSQAGALLHLCRTVCRRAEREVVRLAKDEPVNPDILSYLNRLSDLLFVLARYVNKAARKPETPWRKG